MSSIGQQYTFWNLINNYKIVVPKIQRDYVQGRENDTVKKNREEFVEELIASLAGDRPMSLNFVYGTIQNGNEFIPIDGQQRLTTLFLLHLYVFAKKEDTTAIEKLHKQFSYQTRYTTNRFLEDLAKNLPNLLNSSNDHVEDICDLAETIRISGWYVTPWDNDPNIRSCLVMLQTIHEEICKKDSRNFAGCLTKADCPITFMWLQLDKSFGSDNQLYIRMNSRGKQLTDFENFKAELYEKVLTDKDTEEFKKNIDGEWYSMLWDTNVAEGNVKDNKKVNIEKKASLIDNLLRRLLHWIIVSSICANKEATVLTSTSKNSSDDFINNLYADLQSGCEIGKLNVDDYLDLYRNISFKDNNKLNDYKQLDDNKEEEWKRQRIKNFKQAIIEDFSKTLSYLSKLKKIKDEDKRNIFLFIINDILQISQGKKNTVVYKVNENGSRVLLYAITKFAKVYGEETGKETDESVKINAFKSWYRVVLNLVSTKEIDSPEDFQKAVRAIAEWDKNTKMWLSKDKVKSAFRPEQVKEEKLKLELIEEGERKNIDWKSAILEAENTNFDQGYKARDYFRGQIGFLLYMAGVNERNLKNLNQDQLDDFKYYSKAVREIFDEKKYWGDDKEEKINSEPNSVDEIKSGKDYSFDNLFHRAMLTKGNYWKTVKKDINTFFVYSESHNNYDWRGAFRFDDYEKGTMAVNCFRELLIGSKMKQLHEFKDFYDYLKTVVENFPEQKFDDLYGTEDEKTEELLKYLIKEPKCFDFIKKNYYVGKGDKCYLMEHSIWRTDTYKTIGDLIGEGKIKKL